MLCMKLFTLGPVEMYPSTKSVRFSDIPYFRTQEFGNVVKDVLSRLSAHIGLNNDGRLIYLASSGTGAMEAVVLNCVNKDDKVLVINGGTFGNRFCELLSVHNIPYSDICLEWNEKLTAKHFELYSGNEYTHLFVNLHETSTGQLYDIDLISSFCKKNKMYLIVDAIGTFMIDDYNMGKHNIDVTIISSQKGLCLSPGMSVIALSNRMIERIFSDISHHLQHPIYYLDFRQYLDNIARGQTPFTPPIFIIYELLDMLNRIESGGGRNAWLETINFRCKSFRGYAKEVGFILPEYPLSNMLTPVVFHDVDAYKVFEILKDKYRLYVCPVGGKLKSKILRISHIGNLTLQDGNNLVEKLLLVTSDLKKGIYDN